MNHPFHITHVIDSLARSGGSERQLLVNLGLFSDSRIEHRLVVLRPGADNRLGEAPESVPTSVLFDEDDRLNRWSVASKLYRHLRPDPPDLIHCVLPGASYACRAVGPLLRTPVVESLVNISHEPIRAVDNPNVTESKLKAHAVFDRLTMRHFAGYHAVGPTVADSWHRTVGLPLHKIEVIPRGVPTEVLDDVPTSLSRQVIADLGLPEDAFVLLAVGRQEPQKGHRYAIEAMSSILTDIPTAHLLIAGRAGHSTARLLSLIDELGLHRHVHLLGSRPDINELLMASDVFVFPSLYEGNGGNALIEAMAAGRPVIVSNAPPMTEVANSPSVAMRCDLRSPSSIASAVVTLRDDPSLREHLGEAARSRVSEMLPPLAVAQQTEAWYLRLLAR